MPQPFVITGNVGIRRHRELREGRIEVYDSDLPSLVQQESALQRLTPQLRAPSVLDLNYSNEEYNT